MDTASILGLLGFLGACFAVSASGAYFRPGEWYERLAKPRWRPPNWVFPPAWGLLYICIAVSGWLVWREAGFSGAAVPLAVYAVQLAFNAAWSAIFFGLRRIDLAFVEVVGLWLSIVATMVVFFPVHAGAAWLLAPYLCWVSFASALNFAVWRLNRGPAPGFGGTGAAPTR